MANVLDPIPVWAIMLVVLALVIGVSFGGSAIGRLRPHATEKDEPATVIQNAAFTITGLLLGFSFALALGRDSNRRLAYIQETNAIESAYMRASLLDDSSAKYVRDGLRRYVAYRIDFARADADPARRGIDENESRKIQTDLWNVGSAAERRDPHSTAVPLFLTAMTDTIGLSTQQNTILTSHIPDIVMIALVLIALVAAGMMGFVFERAGKKDTAPRILYAVVFALAIGLVFDLDRPQRGFVRINLAPMIALQERMGGGQAP